MVSKRRISLDKARDGRGRFTKSNMQSMFDPLIESLIVPDIMEEDEEDPVTEKIDTEVYRIRNVDMSTPIKRRVYGEASLRNNPCGNPACEQDRHGYFPARTAYGIGEKTPWNNMNTETDVRSTVLRFCSVDCLKAWKGSAPDNNRARRISSSAKRVLISARTGLLPTDPRTTDGIRARRTWKRNRTRRARSA